MSARRCLADLLDAVSLDPPSYGWLGESYEIAPPEHGDDDAMRRGLAQRLYTDFFTTGGVAPPAPRPEGAVMPWRSEPEDEFSSANQGRGSRQGGWVATERDGARIAVERGGVRLWADPSQVYPGERGGDQVDVVLPKESTGLPSGFYTAYGDAGTGVTSDSDPVDRFYWSIRAEGRAALVAAVTRALNARGVPFRFKVLNDPEVVRCDAGVLYTTTALRRRIAPILGEIASAVAPSLRASVPALTKPLAPGLAFAEDPPGDESFGTHRCALLADAMVVAHARGAEDTDDRLAMIAERLAQEGLSLDAPHLNPGSDPARDPPPLTV